VIHGFTVIDPGILSNFQCMEKNDNKDWARSSASYPGNPGPHGHLTLPNSSPVLMLGIASIALCWIFGFISLIFAIISLVLASGAEKEYARNSQLYTPASYQNMRTGRLCAIIGLCLGLISFLILVFWMVFFGAMMFSFLGFSSY
jgi:hypothetical protein